MFWVRLISSAIYLPQILWEKLIKIITYHNNCSPTINDIICYKPANHSRSNQSHLKVVGSWALVYISQEKRFKLDIHSWQGIFIGYEGKINTVELIIYVYAKFISLKIFLSMSNNYIIRRYSITGIMQKIIGQRLKMLGFSMQTTLRAQIHMISSTQREKIS